MIDITILWILAVISGYFFPTLGNVLSLATIGMGIIYAQRKKDRRLASLGIALGFLGLIAAAIFGGKIEVFGIAPLPAIAAALAIAIGVAATLQKKDKRYVLGGIILGILALLAAGIASSIIIIYGITIPPLLFQILVTIMLLALVGFAVVALQRKKIKIAIGTVLVLGIVATLFYFSIQKPPPTPMAKKPPSTSPSPIKDIPSSPERDKAMEIYHQGKFTEAIPLLEKEVKKNPEDFDTLYKLATAYEATARSDKAIEALKKVIRIKPEYWEPYYSLGLLLSKYGKIDQSLQAFKKAVALEPKAVGAHMSLAGVYFQKKQYNNAIDELKQAIKFTPENSSYLAVVHNQMAQVYLAQKKKAEAIDEWQTVLKIDPQNKEAKTYLQQYAVP